MQIDLAACGESWRIHLTGVGKECRLTTIADGLLALDGDTSGQSRRAAGISPLAHRRAAEVLGPTLHACGTRARF